MTTLIMRAATSFFVALAWLAITALLPVEAHAYIDPGTTGMLSQILYILFYGALGVFLYMLRYIRSYLTAVKQFVARLLGRRS
jgi:hypothetical protein